ncbi:Dyp-type peroxidase [Microbacterium sp. NPDC076911]|uniref:Dyp-type peroxidase n=1 Tax=Microbacterium sp. NPDC076911 TaxID=3154958 RepID=UPI0034371D61
MTGDSPDDTSEATGAGISRRTALFGGLAGIGVGAAAGVAATRALADTTTPSPVPTETPAPEGQPVDAAGAEQAGITRPAVRQAHALIAVGFLDVIDSAVDERAAHDAIQAALASAGLRILALCTPPGDETVTPDGPGDLTVTIGLGDRPLQLSDDPSTAELVAIPMFAGDSALPATALSGDVFISVNATDPGVLDSSLRAVTEALGGVTLAWSQLSFRGYAAAGDGVSRNPFGYFDGITVPRTAEDLAADVWISTGPLAGGTICVARRFELDTGAFASLELSEQDAVMGRERATGVPLSGGERDDDINLLSKSAEGDFLVPAHSHARAAHPSFTGSLLMLRRSYNYVNSADDVGHVFLSYSIDTDAFAKTMVRMEEIDGLFTYMHATAGGAFAILPGYDARTPLGATLFS